MSDCFERTRILIGSDALDALERSRVGIFGLGGVGSYAAEALARAGIGSFLLVDNASVSLTNINRQLLATRSSLGAAKVDVMRARILDINPDAGIEVRREAFGPRSPDEVLGTGLSYIVEAIDTVSAKIDLVLRAKRLGLPIVSAMGAGNKLDPTRLEVADIYQTSVCPLARVMRKELKRLGVESLTVIYSREKPLKGTGAELSCRHASICHKAECPCGEYRAVPGSISFVPSVAGLLAASVVVRAIIGAR